MTRLPHARRALLVTVSTATVAALALSGCTSSSKPSSPSTTPSSGVVSSGSAKTIDDVKKVLIQPSDIPTDTFTLTNLSPVSQSGAVGVSAVYGNSTHKRVVSVILIHYPSVDIAQAAAPQEQTVAAGALTRNPASDNPLAVGQQGELYQGANDTGPLSIAVFAEGAWVVTIEFISKTAGDNIPASVITAVSNRQDMLLKTAK